MAANVGSLGATHVGSGDWILACLHPCKQDTGSLVPGGFEGYCRIFHPVVPTDVAGPVRTWTQVAWENGRIAHASMQFHMIDHPPGVPTRRLHLKDGRLSWGSLPMAERMDLIELLRQYTATPDRCWLGFWAGYDDDVGAEEGEVLRLPGREYVVRSGSIDYVVASGPPENERRSPNLWWPEDRRWIVVTDVDFAWTYVGGPGHLVEDLLSHRDLEVMPVTRSDKPFFGCDDLNASLDE